LDDYTAKYIEAFWEDFDALGCERPEVAPRATQHIEEMANLIDRLEKNNHAYRSDGSIYYRITSFPQYGKLSKINFAGNIAGGSDRVDTDKYEKEDARDFALWKAPAKADEVSWDSIVGKGRPGWHIECSAMSMKYLGESFDLHVGGIDLVFPHHENEIAQSEGATGKQFVRYWFHFEHLKVEGETMSKSKGNYYTFRDVREKGFTAAGVRYFLLSVPFRKQLNFTFDALRGAETTVASLRDFRARVREARCEPGSDAQLAAAIETALKDFESGMDDDLNTSIALAAIHDLTREINTALARQSLHADDQRAVLSALVRIDGVLNVIGEEQTAMLDDEIQGLIDQRQEARHRRDFKRADEIRNELLQRDIILEDTKDGVRWKRK
jgi:cysteinyl-tRNA synthetase